MMKSYCALFVTTFISIWLVGCATNPTTGANKRINETWMQTIPNSPERWLSGADRWFFTGAPNDTEIANRHAPGNAAMTLAKVRVSDFSTIRTCGAYQLQIFASDHNSVSILGPNVGVSSMVVRIANGVLDIQQKDPTPSWLMHKVIVRIGVAHLNCLVQGGSGSIEVVRLPVSIPFSITSSGSGDIYVAGYVNLRNVTLLSSGNIVIVGVEAQAVRIRSNGSGAINLAGHVGIQSITHHQVGDINIIGAYSPGILTINTDCAGTIAIRGWLNLCKINATDRTRVYLCSVSSSQLTVNLYGQAALGIAGRVKDLFVKTNQSSTFLGANLCAENAYVEAFGQSHQNISASHKAFVHAADASTVYFYGPSNLLTPFLSGAGVIVPLEYRNWCNMNSEYRPYAYTLSSPMVAPVPRHRRAISFHYKGEG